LSKKHKLHTTRSWEFLGLHRNGKNSAWQKGSFGENTIIANIDTGQLYYLSIMCMAIYVHSLTLNLAFKIQVFGQNQRASAIKDMVPFPPNGVGVMSVSLTNFHALRQIYATGSSSLLPFLSSLYNLQLLRFRNK